MILNTKKLQGQKYWRTHCVNSNFEAICMGNFVCWSIAGKKITWSETFIGNIFFSSLKKNFTTSFTYRTYPFDSIQWCILTVLQSLIDSKILRCMVRLLLGNNTDTLLLIYIWTIFLDWPSIECCNGMKMMNLLFISDFRFQVLGALGLHLSTRYDHIPFLQVFTCVALFNTLISPLNSFPWVINGLVDVRQLAWPIIPEYQIT